MAGRATTTAERAGGLAGSSQGRRVKVLQLIRETLARGEDVLISGFGKFEVRDKKARWRRNPQTGEDLLLREHRVVTFKPAATLRAKLNPQAKLGPRAQRVQQREQNFF